MHIRRTNIITVIEPGKEEVDCDHVNADLNTVRERTKKEVDVHGKSIDEFCAQKEDGIRKAMPFRLHYQKDNRDPESEFINWDIFPDTESVDWDEVNLAEKTVWMKDIPLDKDSNLNDILFERFFLVLLDVH